jgi:two-component system NtrC family sensor kinase
VRLFEAEQARLLLHSREGSGEHRPVDINTLVEGNLDKVVQHGKRADAIVKNMESLNLAYYGARAEKQGFNITMERSLDPACRSGS